MQSSFLASLVLLTACATASSASTTAASAKPEVTAVEPSLASSFHDPDLPTSHDSEDDDYRNRGFLRDELGKADEPALKGRLLSVTLKTLDDRGEWWSVPIGYALYSGEPFLLELEPRVPAYVYVIAVSASKSAAIVFPLDNLGDERSALPAKRFHIPDPTSSKPVFRLDDCPGTERVVVIASPQRLQPGDAIRRVLERVSKDGRSSDVIKPSKLSHPNGAGRAKRPTRREVIAELETASANLEPGAKDRGGASELRTHGTTLDMQSTTDGVAVATLHFEHLAGSRPAKCAAAESDG